MKMSDAFPSKYLRSSDLDGGNLRVVMQHVQMEKLGDDTKPVLYFKGQEKGLVLNKTNAKTIAEVYGDESDDWAGGELILFTVMTEMQGKQTEGLRVRAPQPKDNPRPAVPQNGGPRRSSAQMGRDDDIPPPSSHDDYRS